MDKKKKQTRLGHSLKNNCFEIPRKFNLSFCCVYDIIRYQILGTGFESDHVKVSNYIAFFH